jgi:small subunit ribosomal protein S2
MQQIRNAVQVVKEVVGKRKSILFVGTKKQAKSVVRECAEECGESTFVSVGSVVL